MPLLIAANEVANEQKVTSKKKWITSRRVVRRKYRVSAVRTSEAKLAKKEVGRLANNQT